MKRRTALGYLGIGAAGTVLFPHPWLAAPDRLADLAGRFRKASAGELFDVAAAAIVEGADPNAILGASFLAGVHDVRPRPVGGSWAARLEAKPPVAVRPAAMARKDLRSQELS